MIILEFIIGTCNIHVLISYVSSPLSFRELCDLAIREMNDKKFLYET